MILDAITAEAYAPLLFVVFLRFLPKLNTANGHLFPKVDLVLPSMM